MIYGEFNSQGELIFEIDLVAADGDIIPVQALLDTGFSGWLAIDNQDALSLGWLQETKQKICRQHEEKRVLICIKEA